MVNEKPTVTTNSIRELIEDAKPIMEYIGAQRWLEKVRVFLETAFGTETAATYRERLGSEEDAWNLMERALGFLHGLLYKYCPTAEPASTAAEPATVTHRVFIVHGHDEVAKQTLARWVEGIDLEAVVLDERPSRSHAVIEKLERYSDVGFALVILSPDDIGASVRGPERQKHRARQNVLFEMGYFVGRLGRGHVCALYKGDTEIPSDLAGVVYISMDADEGWKLKVAREFYAAGLPFNRDKLPGHYLPSE